jgi:hypothetical protein
MATPAIQPYVPRYVKMREQQRLDADAAASSSASGLSPTTSSSERSSFVLPSSFPVPFAPPGHRRPSPLLAPHPLPRIHNHSLLLSNPSLGSSTSSSSSSSSSSGPQNSGSLAGALNNERRQSVLSFHEDKDLYNNDAAAAAAAISSSSGLHLDGNILCAGSGALTPPTRPASIYSARIPSPLSRAVTDVDHEHHPPHPPPNLPDISVTPPPDQTTFGARLRNSLSITSIRSHSHSHTNQPAIPGSSTNSIYSNSSSRNGSPNASLVSLALAVVGTGTGTGTAEEKLTALEPPTRRPTYSRPHSSQSSLSSVHSGHSGGASVHPSVASASGSGGSELLSSPPRKPRLSAASSMPSLYEDGDDVGNAKSSPVHTSKTRCVLSFSFFAIKND